MQSYLASAWLSFLYLQTGPIFFRLLYHTRLSDPVTHSTYIHFFSGTGFLILNLLITYLLTWLQRANSRYFLNIKYLSISLLKGENIIPFNWHVFVGDKWRWSWSFLFMPSELIVELQVNAIFFERFLHNDKILKLHLFPCHTRELNMDSPRWNKTLRTKRVIFWQPTGKMECYAFNWKWGFCPEYAIIRQFCNGWETTSRYEKSTNPSYRNNHWIHPWYCRSRYIPQPG